MITTIITCAVVIACEHFCYRFGVRVGRRQAHVDMLVYIASLQHRDATVGDGGDRG